VVIDEIKRTFGDRAGVVGFSEIKCACQENSVSRRPGRVLSGAETLSRVPREAGQLRVQRHALASTAAIGHDAGDE
jgi:hypothetical protein